MLEVSKWTFESCTFFIVLDSNKIYIDDEEPREKKRTFMHAKVTLRCSYTHSGNITYQQHQETHHQAKWDLEQQRRARTRAHTVILGTIQRYFCAGCCVRGSFVQSS